MASLWIVFLLVVICDIASGVQTIVYRADRIKIENGNHRCISSCSKKNLSCQIDECTIRETSSITTEGLGIRNVSLEWYTDLVDNRNKLALIVKWQPRDNVGIERTKGYLIDIASGDATYRRCYNFATLLNIENSKLCAGSCDELSILGSPSPFLAKVDPYMTRVTRILNTLSAEDVFYNDCFGKVEGTAVKLGSTIIVNITSLPLDEDDQEYRKSTLAVNIPDCSSGELDMLEECQAAAVGKSTNGQCAPNCNTFSDFEGKVYPINCTISKNVIGVTSEKCDEVNRTVEGVPSPPKHVIKDDEWYKFNDAETGDVKVALNFSWKPRPDSSIKSLLGYTFSVRQLNTGDNTIFSKCYSIHTALTEDHANAEFFYDCYGRENPTSVTPGESFQVTILSLKGRRAETFTVNMPNCADPKMQDVTHCIKENSKTLQGSIDRIICENRTLVYSYFVSPHYGDKANVRFCEKGGFVCGTLLNAYDDLMPSGTLYNISLDSAANLTLNYTIFVEGSDDPSIRKYSYTDLSICLTVPSISVVAVAMITIASFLFLLIIACFVWFIFYRHKYACGPLRRFRDVYWSPTETYPDDYSPPVALPQTTRVYVAFSEDHSLHEDVIHWFCTFLQRELAVDVRCAIWDDNKAAANRAKYVMDNLHEADKVVIVCSEGSKNCLSKQSDAEEGNTDMFTPVVNQACQNLMAGANPEKYVVAHFGYSTQQDIPELLRQQYKFYSKTFNLMGQFEQFYFRLVNVEQYQQGGILKIKEISRYFDPTTRSECGEKLHAAIQLMTVLVQGNPTWYNVNHAVGMTGASSPQTNQSRFDHPVQSLVVPDHGDGEASISRIQHALPPMDVQNGDVGVAGPKVRSVSKDPHYENLCEENHHNAPVPAQQRQNEMLLHPMYQNLQIPVPRSNQYTQESTAEWTSSKRQPLEHSEQKREPLEHSMMPDSTESSFEIAEMSLKKQPLQHSEQEREPLEQSMMPDSTESSFEISDTDINSLSPSAAQPVESTAVPQLMHSALYNADSFATSDFPMSGFDNEAESQLMTNGPPNVTQMTSLGPENSMQSQEVQEQNKLINQLLAPVRVPSMEDSPESALFTLANLDKDEADLEDQIKSINILSNFGTDF